MKRTILFFILALHLSINAQDVQKLHEKGDFIQLVNMDIENWESDSFWIPFLRMKTYNAMGRNEESNKEIEFLLTTNEAKENRDLMFELLT